MSSKSKCVRCGICCIIGCCVQGKENEDGYCEFLIVHEDLTTSCKRVLHEDYDPAYITIDKGCHLRGRPDFFKELENDYSERKKFI